MTSKYFPRFLKPIFT